MTSRIANPYLATSSLILLTAVASRTAAVETAEVTLDRLQTINRLAKDGTLAEDLAAAYRVATFTRPELLPPEIAARPAPKVDCATPAFIDAYQLSHQGRLGRAAAELYQASGRPTSVGYYDSAVYPVRVHYTTAALASAASSVLDYVEFSWQKQTETIGLSTCRTIG